MFIASDVLQTLAAPEEPNICVTNIFRSKCYLISADMALLRSAGPWRMQAINMLSLRDKAQRTKHEEQSTKCEVQSTKGLVSQSLPQLKTLHFASCRVG